MTQWGPGFTLTPGPAIVLILLNQDDYNMLLLTMLVGPVEGRVVMKL